MLEGGGPCSESAQPRSGNTMAAAQTTAATAQHARTVERRIFGCCFTAIGSRTAPSSVFPSLAIALAATAQRFSVQSSAARALNLQACGLYPLQQAVS